MACVYGNLGAALLPEKASIGTSRSENRTSVFRPVVSGAWACRECQSGKPQPGFQSVPADDIRAILDCLQYMADDKKSGTGCR